MTDDAFDRQRAFGKRGELLVSEAFQVKGWGINATYNYSGEENDKAPKLHFLKRGLILPDLDRARRGKRRFCEVKHLTRAVFNRRLGFEIHGIYRKHFQHYLEVQAETGTVVDLAVREASTGEILIAQLDELSAYPCQCKNCEAEIAKRAGDGRSQELDWIHRGRAPFWGCRAGANRDLVYFPRSEFLLYATTPPDVSVSATA